MSDLVKFDGSGITVMGYSGRPVNPLFWKVGFKGKRKHLTSSVYPYYAHVEEYIAYVFSTQKMRSNFDHFKIGHTEAVFLYLDGTFKKQDFLDAKEVDGTLVLRIKWGQHTLKFVIVTDNDYEIVAIDKRGDEFD